MSFWFWVPFPLLMIGSYLVMKDISGDGAPKVRCDCGFADHHLIPFFRGPHVKSWCMFVIVVTHLGASVLMKLVVGGVPLITAAVAGAYLGRWWMHTKHSRKKLAEKVLGRVKEMAWGLKVVPVGAAAMLVLASCDWSVGVSP
jgi:hypothetical protein